MSSGALSLPTSARRDGTESALVHTGSRVVVSVGCTPHGTKETGGKQMLDVFFIVVTALFAAVSILYVLGCERL